MPAKCSNKETTKLIIQSNKLLNKSVKKPAASSS